jgi:hypothetical protein
VGTELTNLHFQGSLQVSDCLPALVLDYPEDGGGRVLRLLILTYLYGVISKETGICISIIMSTSNLGLTQCLQDCRKVTVYCVASVLTCLLKQVFSVSGGGWSAS